MSTQRDAHQLDSHYPLNGGQVCMDLCQPCRYFRGAVQATNPWWTVICNWPRDGAELATAPEILPSRNPIPDVFLEAFQGDTDA